MEDYPKIFDCTHIDLRCENITKQELLDYIKERLDKLTDEDTLSEVAGYAVVRVEQKKDCANFREIIRTELEKMVKENPPCL